MLQFIAVVIIAVLVAVDQGIKYLAVLHLEPIGSFPLLDGILQLSYVENTGAAFGSFSKYTVLLSVFTGIVLLCGFAYLLFGKNKPVPVYIAAILILSGGAGNLIDRVFRGFVVDYIEPLFINFAVFNFADILVCVGAAVLIVYLLYDMFRDAKRTKQAAEKENATD